LNTLIEFGTTSLFVPVQRLDLSNSKVNPFRRLSASQVIAWKNCPRLWYYGWRERLKTPLPPQIIRGNAAEECICRVLRDSPLYIGPEDDQDMTSPIDETGSPDLDQVEGWIGPSLELRPKDMWPHSRIELEEWAIARANYHFSGCWERAVDDWESIPNRIGNSSDISPEEGLNMVISGIRMHLDELQRCIDGGENRIMKLWREGKFREHWPAPDGFPRLWTKINPAASEGDISWIESWEYARPWFVDPDATPFSQTTSHPDGWFQGEYDLVYRWSGKSSIIDLKASVGKGDRSAGYVEQLRLYAWLWWETHERLDEVEDLEIWYLGVEKVKKVPTPSKEDMIQLNIELLEIYNLIHARDPDISDCPTLPLPLNIFHDGGIPANPSIDNTPKSRCRVCGLRAICESSDYETELPSMNRIERFGHAWPVTSLGEIKTRFSVTGEVLHLQGPEISDKNDIQLSFTLQHGYDRAKVRNHRNGGFTSISRSISEGSKIRIDNALSSLWKGQLVIDLDEKSEISILNDSFDAPIVDVETRISVVGRVWSIDAFPDAKEIRRWSITLVDDSGSSGGVAFKQFIPNSAAAITRGDEIAILNGESGEFAGKPQIKIGPGTRVVILRDSEDIAPF